MTQEKFKQKYRIESNRLKDWDYSVGSYFVTICIKDRINYFGDVKNGEMELSQIGEIAKECWARIPAHFPSVALDEYIVMPNHVHGILFLDAENYNDTIDRRRDAINRVSTSRNNAITATPALNNAKYGGVTGNFNPMNKNSLAKIIRWYKGRTTFEIHKSNLDFQWQPRYHDNIIRDEISLQKIREYIVNNPALWETDAENPKNSPSSLNGIKGGSGQILQIEKQE